MKVRSFLAGASVLALALGLAGAGATPIFIHVHGGAPTGVGGGGGGGSGTTFACDAAGTGVCADFASGQTFVQWPDLALGAPGASFRYRMYRSTSPITAGNYTSADLKATRIYNNSGQMFGGNPDVGQGQTFTAVHRQTNDSLNPMARIPDAQAGAGATKPLAFGTGLQVYNALATEDAYYAVVSTNTSDSGAAYLGSVGPISEIPGTPEPIKVADSLSRPASGGYGKIVSPAGKPLVMYSHASAAGGGAAGAGANIWGDYFEWFGDTTQGYYDGRATAVMAYQDTGSGHYPSLSTAMVVANRDSVWNTLGTGAQEGLHLGIGYSIPGKPANRVYPIICRAAEKQMAWAISHYGLDPNQAHWSGASMGAFGGMYCGLHLTNPHLASVWAINPSTRLNLPRSAGFWAGTQWLSTYPYIPTLASLPYPLGSTDASVLQFVNGDSYQDYVDTSAFVTANPGSDLPFVAWSIGYDDPNLTVSGVDSFDQEIHTVNAMQAAHRGHVFAYAMAHHDANPGVAINCNFVTGGDPVNCYGMSLFALNRPYPAFDHSSIDDTDYDNTRDAAGVPIGAKSGCINCGFKWSFTTDTASNLAFTVRNTFMGNAATVHHQTTLLDPITSTAFNTTYNVGDTTGWPTLSLGATNQNAYVRIGNEIVVISNKAANQITIANGSANRGALNTIAQAHSPGETVTQYTSKPSGPNIGPQTSMTVNVTPRRLQNFIKTNGTVLNCTYTPFGESPVAQTPTVANGIFTLIAVKINVGGNTAIACS